MEIYLQKEKDTAFGTVKAVYHRVGQGINLYREGIELPEKEWLFNMRGYATVDDLRNDVQPLIQTQVIINYTFEEFFTIPALQTETLGYKIIERIVATPAFTGAKIWMDGTCLNPDPEPDPDAVMPENPIIP